MEYTVILHPAEEGGYWVEVPALPGCFFKERQWKKLLPTLKKP